ncbi:KH domain-containing, RNA-binding, signal transduction-associated protein 2-like isoform X2 [Anneissia japonica]|uniref:KH domain-containing, RNA-binding, signal transduction-associated protein 2-like isoform X2 n=1 Tax=Anneissia japonica TaxID=1529436 RepID=UPI001425A9BC|nr:KH domain-containing, RNA-binding, signal transduction-associated protein 2-like isoform X2 [Anneissia japonica]
MDGIKVEQAEPEPQATAGGKERLIEVNSPKPIKLEVRVRIPIKEHPKFNFVGKLLGPRGNSLKRMQEETKTRISILGKGSMRDKQKEEELRNEGNPKYSHLHDELHVHIEAYAQVVEAYQRMATALGEIQYHLVPDNNDDIRMHQIQELAMIKGTFPEPQMGGRGRRGGLPLRGGPPPRGRGLPPRGGPALRGPVRGGPRGGLRGAAPAGRGALRGGPSRGAARGGYGGQGGYQASVGANDYYEYGQQYDQSYDEGYNTQGNDGFGYEDYNSGGMLSSGDGFGTTSYGGDDSWGQSSLQAKAPAQKTNARAHPYTSEGFWK